VENMYQGNEVYELAARTLIAADGGVDGGDAVAVPITISGFTDARAYAAIGIPTFGFVPM